MSEPLIICSAISIKRTPLQDGQYDEERIALLCGQTISEKISIKGDNNLFKADTFFAPMVSAF